MKPSSLDKIHNDLIKMFPKDYVETDERTEQEWDDLPDARFWFWYAIAAVITLTMAYWVLA